MATQAETAGAARETMEYDVVVVGGGPAGLSAAIRLKQRAREAGTDIAVCVLEKGSEIGAHIISGAVMDPRALNELLPEWKSMGAPLNVPVSEDRFLFLTKRTSVSVPDWLLPRILRNEGNYVVSLGNVVRWLGKQAEALGVEIFAGFPAAEILYHDDGSVKGVATRDLGVGRDGKARENFQRGVTIHARYTLFCEGARGHLGLELTSKFGLRDNASPQVHGIGIKELWNIDPAKHRPGLVMHTAGWPLERDTYGGSFLYHAEGNQVAVGFIVGLGYANPWLSPFEEFQRYKTHSAIRTLFEGGTRVAYGARAIAAGGLTALPTLVFPGGALAGDDAGFLNPALVKGSHAAIKTGMLAADAAFDAVSAGYSSDTLSAYPAAFRASWFYEELHRARNFRQWMSKGLYLGALMTGIEQKLMGGRVPWTLRHRHADHETLDLAKHHRPIVYPRPDGKLTFDRFSSVLLSNTNHAEDQPEHLVLQSSMTPVALNLRHYAGPESRYCPAAVYEFAQSGGTGSVGATHRLVVSAQNCLHCKSCDIKDPSQNIVWRTPEGGGGPNYSNM
ncbi:4Fe-4S dicluster domain-containing protein [Cupriavidus sp. 2TAF22]|uniref:electron transfer flavoprotein-ubiquinone oxidoreductase n=1 Tax=unclassified Cupriavidus TaxID=2640874 RepID=UPI003F912284